jgi:hypothetical protein
MPAMSERRQDDRRGDERREFRQQDGRRSERPPRRGSRTRRRRLLFLVVVLALAGFALRVAVVAPRRAAAARAVGGQTSLEQILLDLHPATVSLPDAAMPTPDEPVVGPVVTDPEHQAILSQLEADLAEPHRRFPGELVVADVLGTARLLLGKDVDARHAWEVLWAQGDPEQQQSARLGLGLVALRAGLAATAVQDRGFAFEHALWHLDAIDADFAEYDVARHNRAIVLVELARYDEAREAILAVAADDPVAGSILGTHLVRREPLPDPPARPPP